MKKIAIILFIVLPLVLLATGGGQDSTFYQCTSVDFAGGVTFLKIVFTPPNNYDETPTLCDAVLEK